ncbi:heme-copper oxidase subunit III [Planctomyces sp. SH-PL62]|uniref:cytochrome c oxidase subunit 3 n=1 Tax=Planctomyces sp. SH-PL62 TaxID=1636152 RepID=UPI00078C0AB4|nr:cytochrome c oxidase subunit 3 [Planctomyces sp. SH-PL62]AMV36670.1 Cytochrome c oxidase polypeptide I+III [Planctomyces sp. SH-PL62]
MAQAEAPTHEMQAHHHPLPDATPAPATPGKVAVWLFLATEIMFFTGLIGTYIVCRAGSPPTAYSNLFAPTTPLDRLGSARGVLLEAPGADPAKVSAAIVAATHKGDEEVAHILAAVPHGLVNGLFEEGATTLADDLAKLGATAKVVSLETSSWPKPYDPLTNPLSIDLTTVNTFILICSSATMVLALSAIQRGRKVRCSLYLLATVALGSLFLGIQVYEYHELLEGRIYPPGISPTGHFRPGVSLFASCFFTVTGFHGLHVAAGVVTLALVFLASLTGRYSARNFATIEYAGLYWHFVDVVWILLFTIVYLV